MNPKKQSSNKQFQNKILSWYKQNKRDLPWRKTTNPYHILVSEVMLQQTQVDRVIPYYKQFLKHYPTVQDLARADKTTLLKVWSGLGYNSRVLRLQKLAQQTIEEHNGKLPETKEELLKLPGIGEYTANAVLAFAHNQEVPVLDTNIRRVLIHGEKVNEKTPQEKLIRIAKELVPQGQSCTWHNALMDYGAKVLTARKTGIKSVSQQGKFEGSTRQVRGGLIKHLLAEKRVTVRDAKNMFPHNDFDVILAKMEKDELIKREKDTITLA
jgi:A/G-specific adenine glycosylase